MRKIFVCIIANFLIISSIFAETNNTYGPIKASESLWSIAANMNQSSDVSIPQIMLAILHKNSNAFSVQNINALKPDNTITYPDLSEINVISKNDARTEVEKQNQAWRDVTNKNFNSTAKNKTTKAYKSKHYAHKQHKNTTKIITIPKQAIPKQEALTESKSASLSVIDITTINTEITKLNEQIKAVIEKNNMMQAQLDQINTRVSFVEKSTNKLLRFDITNIFKPLSKYTQSDAVVASCVISSSALLLFIVISLLIQLAKKNPLFGSSREECDIVINKEDEIATKLNLARAYIDMGKNDESRAIIDEVIAYGDPVQKAEAQDLLVKIAQN